MRRDRGLQCRWNIDADESSPPSGVPDCLTFRIRATCVPKVESQAELLVHHGHTIATGGLAVRLRMGGDRVAVGLVADQDSAEVVAGRRRESPEE